MAVRQRGRSISSSRGGYGLGQLQPGSSFGLRQCPAAPRSPALAQRSSSGLSLIFLCRFGVRLAALAFCHRRCSQQRSPWGCLRRKETAAHNTRCTGYTYGAGSVPGARPLLSCSQPWLLPPRWGSRARHRHPVAVRRGAAVPPVSPSPASDPTEQSRVVGCPSCAARGWIGCANTSHRLFCAGELNITQSRAEGLCNVNRKGERAWSPWAGQGRGERRVGLFQPRCRYVIRFPNADLQMDRLSVPAWGQQKWGFLCTLGAESAQHPDPSRAALGLGERLGCKGRGAARLPPSRSLNPLCCPVNRVSLAVPSSIIKFPFIPTKPSLLCLDRDIRLCIPPCSGGRRWLAPRARLGARWQRWLTLQSRQLPTDLCRG